MLLQRGFSGLGKGPYSCGTAPDLHRTYPVPEALREMLQPYYIQLGGNYQGRRAKTTKNTKTQRHKGSIQKIFLCVLGAFVPLVVC